MHTLAMSLPLEGNTSGFTFYDVATFAIFLCLLALVVVSLFYLFKAKISPMATLGWLAVILLLPVLGSVAFLAFGRKATPSYCAADASR